MDPLWYRFIAKTPFARIFTEEWLPSFDMSDTKDNFVVKAELPGLEAKGVNVTISGDLLTIKGEKKKEEEEKYEHNYCVERYSGSFQRSFRLPLTAKRQGKHPLPSSKPYSHHILPLLKAHCITTRLDLFPFVLHTCWDLNSKSGLNCYVYCTCVILFYTLAALNLINNNNHDYKG